MTGMENFGPKRPVFVGAGKSLCIGGKALRLQMSGAGWKGARQHGDSFPYTKAVCTNLN